MPPDLYTQLSSLPLLQKGWHLARRDSHSFFMEDPFRYGDFANRLEAHLINLSQNLSSNSYHPKPSLNIDVPKSTLSVRPGSVLAIEDMIVLFAIIYLIAPNLDKKLPKSVYSYRLKVKPRKDELFYDHEILKFPFLKKETIQRKIEILQPWYGTWPKFIEDVKYAYEKEDYKFLVISDIASYFENIDLTILRDILIINLPKQLPIINFLINLYRYWSWPAIPRITSPTWDSARKCGK